MEIRKKFTNNCYRVILNVINLKSDFYNVIISDYFNSIVSDRKENGRYMIKKQTIKHITLAKHLKAYRKTYFCYANKGICFTYKRKDCGIFYINNYAKILRLAKYLANSDSELISIVDRRLLGKETYILNKSQTINKSIVFVN